jgi:outer membrane protein assembly factor BamB
MPSGKGAGKGKGAPEGKGAGKGKGARKPEGKPSRFERLLADLALLRHPKRFWKDKRKLALALIAVLVLGLTGVAVAYEALKRPADVHNPDAIFKPEKPPPEPKKARFVNWPMFGLNPARTRYLPARGVHPPFARLWRFTDKPLLEFPPIFVNGRLFFVNNNGFAHALDADTGKTLWERRVGKLNASSPAYSRGYLYIVNLEPGHLVKLDAKTGREIWKRPLPGRAESSPVVVGRTVYFGCENGELFAVSTRNGKTRWSTSLGGPIKSAPAYSGGSIYVGDYGGYMNKVDARSGKLVWQSGSLGPGFGASGQFYSTPAVAFGRVYSGNNDGRVYSFDSTDGTLAWSYSTGGYVYSGPTVATTKHSPPTVYIGSFDGNIYALDAKDGSVRWSQSAGGQVIGSLSAVGEIVYVSEFTGKTTSGFMMRSGRRVFHYAKGTYTPVISDGHRIFLTGYSSITALVPVTEAQLRQAARRQAAEAKRQAAGAKRKAQARAKRKAAGAKRKAEARAKREAKAKASVRASRPHQGAAAAGAERP